MSDDMPSIRLRTQLPGLRPVYSAGRDLHHRENSLFAATYSAASELTRVMCKCCWREAQLQHCTDFEALIADDFESSGHVLAITNKKWYRYSNGWLLCPTCWRIERESVNDKVFDAVVTRHGEVLGKVSIGDMGRSITRALQRVHERTEVTVPREAQAAVSKALKDGEDNA